MRETHHIATHADRTPGGSVLEQRIAARQELEEIGNPIPIRVGIVTPLLVALRRVAHHIPEALRPPVEVVVVDDHGARQGRFGRCLSEEVGRCHPEGQLLPEVAGIDRMCLQGAREPRFECSAVEGNIHCIRCNTRPTSIIADPLKVDVRAAHSGWGEIHGNDRRAVIEGDERPLWSDRCRHRGCGDRPGWWRLVRFHRT